MKEERKHYSREFKQKAIELSDLRGNAQAVARELGIDVKLIYRWRRELSDKPGLAFSGNGNQQLTDEQKEVAKLRKELADVKMERDILKKAISIFSVSDSKSSGS
jgi:transposase